MSGGRELFDLDKVSLECFTNQHQYKKYLAKKGSATHPPENNHALLCERSVLKADQLMKLFGELVHNTYSSHHLLDSKYIPFVEACLDHLEKMERIKTTQELLLDTAPISPTHHAAAVPEYWKMHSIIKEEGGKKKI
jgi:hypothetical protein